jgi:uncharacterized membrane protein YdbT with pleckstrin-like domain
VSYVDRNLAPGESVLLRARYHWVRFVPGALVAMLGFLAGTWALVAPAGAGAGGGIALVGWLGVAGLVGGLAAVGWRALVDSFDEYVITTFRVVCKRGFLKRTVRQVPLDKVQDLNLQATFWGRWLAYGDVEVQTAGADGTVVFPRIYHPEEFRNVLFAHLQGRNPANAATAAAPPVRPVTERMQELESLRSGGLVSDAEYRAKREALLREL